VAVLDVDSSEYDQFDSADRKYLEEIVALLQF
jgi:putative methionine-R-sulfoxide reductase with GAF domain